MDPLTGELYLVGGLDFETTPSYSLTVEAIDYGATALTGTATVDITVTDVNDNTPVCTTLAYSVTGLDEHSVSGTAVTTIGVCTDADEAATVNSQLQYSIISGNTGSALAIDANTGDVTVGTAASLDAETQEVFSLGIRVSDLGAPSLYIDLTLSVTLNDVNENAPVFQPSDTYAVDVAENEPQGTLIEDIDATDDDTGANGEILYSITAGDPGSLFYIDPTTGIVSLQGDLDRETQDVHTLTIVATDQADPGSEMSATGTLSVTVLDYNDNAPDCPDTVYAADTAEDSAAGTAVVTVACTDIDLGDNQVIDYSIASGDPLSQFAIDATTGDITVAAPLDYETTILYQLVILAEDRGAGATQLTGTTQVTMHMY